MQLDDILKEINSYWIKFCLKIALFSHFCAGFEIRTNYIQFLNFVGNLDFLQKSFITSTTGLETFPNGLENIAEKNFQCKYWKKTFIQIFETFV